MSKRLEDLTTDELAAHLMKYPRARSGGAAFAAGAGRVNKSLARDFVSACFSTSEFPKGLSILTMPGVDWVFERHLLACRERQKALADEKIHQTFICAIEEDEALYRLALCRMPGFRTSLVMLAPPRYASATFRSRLVQRFHRCTLEDLVMESEHAFDGAWLDFTGSLTFARMESLRDFWSRLLRYRLAITVTYGRYGREGNARVAEHGSLLSWLLGALPGAQLVRGLKYIDTSQMAQIVLDKAERPREWDASKGRNRR